ncbi:MAG: hypothetical protein M0Z46_10615 [Actinomycetota bacterium]|jgi:hypothetical protein|nr:hypothetical protein [Actinomycetota bacterium]
MSWDPPSGGGGSGTVKKVSSANASVTVTTPTGPTVGIEVATSPKLGGTAAATFAKKATVPSIVTAETSTTGVALINGTQTILTVTVPNDGKFHSVLWWVLKYVTVAITGGTVSAHWTTAHGTVNTDSMAATAAGAHFLASSSLASAMGVPPGTAVTIAQASSMTAGAAKVYAKIVII